MEAELFLGILQRMIFWELLKVFVVSLIGITGILLMAGVVAEAQQQGLGPAQVLLIIPLLIPSTLPWTLPATTLFATCFVYGRLAHDNEILAIKSAGVNVTKVMGPAIVLGVVMSAVTLTLYYRIIPHTHGLMRSLVMKDIEELLYAMLKKEGKLANARLPYAIYVKGVQGRTLQEPIFMRRNAGGQWDTIAAREAVLQVDMKRRVVMARMRDAEFIGSEGSSGKADENKPWEVPLPEMLSTDYPRKPRDLSWKELYSKEDELLRHEQNVRESLANARAGVFTGPPPTDVDKHVSDLESLYKYLWNEIRNMRTERLMRPAIAFGCLFFVLVGCPVGIWLSRSDYLSSFVTCFLPIVLLYYPLLLCGSKFSSQGKPFPALCVWAANGVMGVAALLLSWRVAKN